MNTNTYRFLTRNAEETKTLAAAVGRLLKAGDVIAYTGGMGAGKTTFTTGLAQGLGVTDWVSSPTFSLINEYRGPIPLCHFDLFRVTNADDLYATGFFDYLDGRHILAVEWTENVPEALPPDAIRVHLEDTGENCRQITITGDERFEALCS